MPGALLQLSSVSDQDTYLTINPQISYFKSVYYSYHNYAKITFDINLEHSDSSFFKKQKYNLRLPKYGDLVKELYLKVNLPSIYTDPDKFHDVKWIYNFQFKLINHIKFSIGGRTIQEFDSDFLYLYYTLSLNKDKKDILKYLTGETYTEKYKPGIIFDNKKEFKNKNINGVDIKYLNKNYNRGNSLNKFETIIPTGMVSITCK